MAALHKSCDSWIVEKEGALAREHRGAADVVAKLDRNEVLSWLAEAKAQVVEDQAKAIEEWARATDGQAKDADEWAKSTNEWAKVAEEKATAS